MSIGKDRLASLGIRSMPQQCPMTYATLTSSLCLIPTLNFRVIDRHTSDRW
jgi:hypothetical protein